MDLLCVFRVLALLFSEGFLIADFNLNDLLMLYVYAKKPRGITPILNKFNK